MKRLAIKPAWAVMLLAAALMGGAQAKSPRADAGDKPESSKAKKKSGRAGGGQVKFLPGSAETARERSTRLKRECKGRVNAGACEGYTN